MLVEFLGCVLEALWRPRQAPVLPPQSPRQPHLQLPSPWCDLDEGADLRTEARWELFQLIFVDTTVVPHLFKLLICPGSVQFESAALLHALLRNALELPRTSPLGGDGSLWSHAAVAAAAGASMDTAERLLPQYWACMDDLGELLIRGSASKLRTLRAGSGSSAVAGADGAAQLALSGGCGAPMLGAFRVAVLQILVALSELAPEKTLPLIKPPVWEFLASGFLAHRRNHIFQAICRRLWMVVIAHGGPKLQHRVFVKHRLLVGICEAVLAEGACGDCWHEMRLVRRLQQTSCSDDDAAAGAHGDGTSAPQLRRRSEKTQVSVRVHRHPGGLGGMVPVLRALAEHADQLPATLPQEQQPPGLGGVFASPQRAPVAGRTPLGERFVQTNRSPTAPIKTLGAQEIKAAGRSGNENDPLATLASAGGVRGGERNPSYIARLLAATPLWAQAYGALGRGGPQVECPNVLRDFSAA